MRSKGLPALSLAALLLCMPLAGCEADDAAYSRPLPSAQVMAEPSPQPETLNPPALLKGYAFLALLPGDRVDAVFDVVKHAGDRREVTGIRLVAREGDPWDAGSVSRVSQHALDGLVLTRYRVSIAYERLGAGPQVYREAELAYSSGERARMELGKWCVEKKDGTYASGDLYAKNAVSVSGRPFETYYVSVARRGGRVSEAEAKRLRLVVATGEGKAPPAACRLEDGVATLSIENWGVRPRDYAAVTLYPLIELRDKDKSTYIRVGNSAIYSAAPESADALKDELDF